MLKKHGYASVTVVGASMTGVSFNEGTSKLEKIGTPQGAQVVRLGYTDLSFTLINTLRHEENTVNTNTIGKALPHLNEEQGINGAPKGQT